MSEKRRGLGRGLGALIPTSSEGKRPVDVFFPSPAPEDGGREEAQVGPSTSLASPTVATGAEGERVGVTTLVADDDAGPSNIGTLTSIAPADHDGLDAPAGSSESWDDAIVLDRGAPSREVEGGSASSEDSSFSEPRELEVSRETVGEAAIPAQSELRRGVAPTGPTSGASEDSTAPSADSTTTQAVSADWTGQPGDDLVPVPGARFAELPTASIRPNPRQPRSVFDEGELDELVGSIREIGVLQPVVVRPVTGSEGQYELIMGERRWRATQAAGLDVIPAIVRETDDGDLLRDALLENLHRSALNPLEEAAAYRQLLDDFGCTHEELADRISRSRPQISNTLRLLRLPPLVQRRVAAGVLSAGHARALLGLTDGAEIERLAQRIVAEGLSVRATEEIVAMGGLDGERRAPRAPRAGQRSAAIDELAHRLSDRFETRVKVDLGKNKGRLTVEFASVEDLNRILDVMVPDDPGLLRN
ncbi:ParB/RepB/Spo0J family partition protein [Cellulosimicrobium protaetiae]|uniref:ParB/RepB/Spo0J family partition protein n=1 Tax=Cellulosimicrobium protaetiae TaxID=2587808 RepID=A0A6M5U9P0_9MICO|nr:ParB/RepB/Spo0J family partition protein [Cellulosimicrobium protaetiae]QJW35196.1 ParB/RepB/Spo0J family partition protein [Cellulosimicrobium protaetiae]